MLNWFKNLFKDDHYRDRLYIGSTKEFRTLYTEAEQHILADDITEAFKTATKLQLYVVTKGDAEALLRLLKSL